MTLGQIIDAYFTGLKAYKQAVAEYHLWMRSIGMDPSRKQQISWPTGSHYNDHLQRNARLEGMQIALSLNEEDVARIQQEVEADANRIYN